MNSSPKRIAAFFDVDKTLLEVNSGRLWLSEEWKRGRIGNMDALRFVGWLLMYRLGVLDFERAATLSLAKFVGRRVDEVEIELGTWAKKALIPRICKEARAAIEHHRSQGHVLALLTSGTSFSVAALAETVQMQHLLCTEVQVENGVVTGRLNLPVCYGEGKVHRAEVFAQEHGIDLSRSFFYSDSSSDRPMFERVGHPIVVNPDPRLRADAWRRGWPVQKWRA